MPTPPTLGCRRKWHYNKPLHAIGQTVDCHNSSDGTIKITGVYTPIKPIAIKCVTFLWHESPSWARASSFSRHHGKTPRLVFLWISDQPDAQASLPENTQLSLHTDIHVPWQDSNPQSQKASDRKTTPYTARTLESTTPSISHTITQLPPLLALYKCL